MQSLVWWVEGDRDRRFFDALVKPRLEPKYAQVLVKEYRQLKQPVVNRLIRAMGYQGFECRFVADMNAAPCVSSRLAKLIERHPCLAIEDIVVVATEIESWYLAGITEQGGVELKIKAPASTDGLTKQDLDRLRPDRFDSELDFLIELTRHFDFDLACQRNRSFAHFCRKHLGMGALSA